MKTGGTCTLHKNYKTAQLSHTAREAEVQPISPSLTLPLNSNSEQTYFMYCVVLLCSVGLFQMQTAKVTVYGS